jgi:hypothetical protein
MCGATYNVWDILERYCPREHGEPDGSHTRGGGVQTAIYNDALRHAERRVRRHLHGTKMPRRETERAQLGRTISRRVVTCPQKKNETVNASRPTPYSTVRPQSTGFVLS